MELGADPLRRNSKNRTPGKQLRLEAELQEWLAEAEEAALRARKDRQGGLWDPKMKAAQSESALRVGTL